MTFTKTLIRVVLLSIPAILVVSVAAGAAALFEALVAHGHDLGRGVDSFVVVFLYSTFIGAVLAFALGAPAYAAYARGGCPFFLLVILAATPGGIVLTSGIGFGPYVLGGGLMFLFVLHKFALLLPRFLTEEAA